MKLAILSVAFLMTIAVILCQSNSIYAHNFYNNQDSIFYSLIKRFEVEKDLTMGNHSVSKQEALKHSQNADSIFKNIVTLNKDITNYKFIDRYNANFKALNLTTKALVAANLADETLKQYGLAKGLDSNTASGLLNMSMDMFMKMTGMSTRNQTDDNRDMGSDMTAPMSTDNESRDHLKLADQGIASQSNYASAISLGKSLKEVFSSTLARAVPENSTGLLRIPMNMKIQSVMDLGNGIDNLNISLNNHSSLDEIYSIVHGQIHPNLFLVYNLQLKGD